jgi:hypothetical protein
MSRDPSYVGAVAFKRAGDPNVGEFSDAVAGFTPFSRYGSRRALLLGRGPQARCRLMRERPTAYTPVLPGNATVCYRLGGSRFHARNNGL